MNKNPLFLLKLIVYDCFHELLLFGFLLHAIITHRKREQSHRCLAEITIAPHILDKALRNNT